MWSPLAGGTQNLVERFCFPVPKPTYDLRSFPGELILVPRDDGVHVPCLYMPFRHARFVVLYFHGNGEDLGTCHKFCTVVRDLFQVHVLAIEYPGYGVCPGETDEAGVLANAEAVICFVRSTLKWPSDGIKLFGRSLGTGPCMALASQNDVAGVVLVSPFLSIREVFRNQVGSFASLIDERFPNISLARDITSPTLIVHGRMDSLIPYDHGRKIFDNIRARKKFVCPALMTHNSCLFQDVSDFVLPMMQFFSLPDYSFEEMVMPGWAYPKGTDFDSPLGRVAETTLSKRHPRVMPPVQPRSDQEPRTGALGSTPHHPAQIALDSCSLREDQEPSIPDACQMEIGLQKKTRGRPRSASNQYNFQAQLASNRTRRQTHGYFSPFLCCAPPRQLQRSAVDGL